MGADATTYKLQIQTFADAVLDGVPQVGVTVDDGLASVQALVAICRSVQSGEWVTRDQVTGPV